MIYDLLLDSGYSFFFFGWSIEGVAMHLICTSVDDS